MSVLTNRDYQIQQLRRVFMRLEDQLAERMMNFPAIDGGGKAAHLGDPGILYRQELGPVPEAALCYSPIIQTVTLGGGAQSPALGLQRHPPQSQSPGQRRLPQPPVRRSAAQKPDSTNRTDISQKPPPIPDRASKAISSQHSSRPVSSASGSQRPLSLSFHRVEMNAPKIGDQNVSVLSRLLRSNLASNNPFKDFSFICGMGEMNPVKLRIFFPRQQQAGKRIQSIVVMVKPTATVEEVIGYALYQYVEEKIAPAIDDQPRLCSIENWNLRIVEDDGTVDEDFPALERSRYIQKFAFDQFALCSNVAIQKTMPREVSRPSIQAKPMIIKVHLYSTLDVKQTTTVSLPGDTTMAAVLDFCCRKRKIDPKEYTLKMADTVTDVPLNQTLMESGLDELCLLRKDRGPSAGDIFLRPPEKNFEAKYEMPKLMSDEYTSMYKRYNVKRRLPRLMGKADVIFAIDGDYIYLMPPDDGSKHFFEAVKATSFHINTVQNCAQVEGTPFFKIVCLRDRERDTKTYDFDAASADEAAEICRRINFIKHYNSK